MKRESEKSDQRKAAIFTAVIHGIGALLMFFLVAFSIQDPPPGDMYVEIGMADYGFDEKAGGDKETDRPSETVDDRVNNETSTQTTPTPTPTPTEKVTQTESTVSVPKGQKTEQPKTEPKPEEQKVSNELANILNKMNQSGGGGSQGTQTGTGNEGSQDGKIDGKGVIGSDGIGFDLGGRGMSVRPVITAKPEESGLVVIDVVVDSKGNVIQTIRNYSESTTSSGALFAMAEEAARKAKFESKDGATPQKGKIYFNFKLK